MFGFEYKYKSPENIIESIKLLSDFSILDYIIIVSLLIFIIFMVFYALPSFYIMKKHINAENIKRKKKNFIKQIALRKDIDEEIEKEMGDIERKKIGI